MLRTDEGQTVKLSDYRPTDFLLHGVSLTIRLFDRRAEIEARLTLERRLGAAAAAPLVLDGDDLTLTELALDGEPLDTGRYTVAPDRLTITDCPAEGTFTLTIGTRSVPEDNTRLMGLYRSNGTWCTQCEAQGFRRITYFYDRPDVLAPYRVRIEADRTAAPVILANGNPVESGDLPDGRRYAVWDDPFNKPSYLFAMVAGDLDLLADSFTTMSGREVALGIYTEKGRTAQAAYAMDALKRSMVWDERRFGREYDLDVFNIAAIADFNMGAMENKGLNVFNHKFVLLDPDTATDVDYAGVETVIAHEYFHNWTGDRITCRDWFQLCLKEGLTVFRDQEFSADEREPTVQRIASVRRLKAHQFPEDQGPLQHPVRPREYREINNFYTATVYDKGAELVRMIATILGRETFRAGMDLYFERHDGEAATIEDFLRCFEDAAERDLSRFALWYEQAGTPTLMVTERYDAAAGRLTIGFEQALEEGPARTGTEPMHLPVRFGLVGANGEDLDAEPAEATAPITGDVVHLTEGSTRVTFEGLGSRPYVSVLRDFSAPVDLKHPQSEEDRLALARLDPNLFNRWRLLNDLLGEDLMAAGRDGTGDAPLRADVIDALLASAGQADLDAAFRAQILALPGAAEVTRMLGQNVDPEAVHHAVEAARRQVGLAGRELFTRLHAASDLEAPFSPDAESAGRRALANAALSFLCAAGEDAGAAAAQVRAARNMTDRLAALTILVHRFPEAAATREALDAFYARYESDELVLDKWFGIQATAPRLDAVEVVDALTAHPKFSLKNPNRVRAVVGTFAQGNQRGFHRADGAGYRWVANRVAELDRLNPQIAARIATTFRAWRSLEPERRNKARDVLEALRAKPGLSKDLADILARSLQ